MGCGRLLVRHPNERAPTARNWADFRSDRTFGAQRATFASEPEYLCSPACAWAQLALRDEAGKRDQTRLRAGENRSSCTGGPSGGGGGSSSGRPSMTLVTLPF